jgi:Asparagine synthase
MSERPVAQVVVFGSHSVHEREEISSRLCALGAIVTEAEPHWIVGTMPLPGGVPDSTALRDQGLAFVEGRDRAEETFGSRLIDETLRCLKSNETIQGLPGDISLVSINSDTATVVRSCAGLGHWFIHRRPGSVMLATRLRFFEDLYDDEFAIDELVLATWTATSVLPWNRTPLLGVTVLPPAHVARIKINEPLSFSCYWDPSQIEPTASSYKQSNDRAEQFRELFTATLDRDLSNESTNMVTFSGGVDSSIVLSMSLALGRRVETVSLIPSLDYADPLPTRRKIDTMLDQSAIHSRWFTEIDEHKWVDLQLTAPAIRVPMLNTTLIEAQRQGTLSGARVVTGGEYADELFGGWNTLYDAWVPSLGLPALTRSLMTAPQLDRNRALRRWVSKRVRVDGVRPPFPISLPTFIRHELRNEYADFVADVRQKLRTPTKSSPNTYLLGQLSHYTGWLLQNWEACSEAGLRRSLPFYNREAIEFALSCRPTELAWPPKKLLRSSFDGLVPASHLHRIDKDSAGASPRANVPMNLSIPPAVESLLDPTRIDCRRPLDPGVAARLAPAVIAARRPVSRRKSHRLLNPHKTVKGGVHT